MNLPLLITWSAMSMAPGAPGEGQDKALKALESEVSRLAKDTLPGLEDLKSPVKGEPSPGTRLADDFGTVIRGVKDAKLEPAYVASLQADADALARARDREVPKDERVRLLRGVAADLNAKAGFEKAVGKDGRRVVKVTAVTKRAGQEVKELQVVFVPRAWDGTEDRYETFPKNSSPTTHEWAPGAYVIWTRDPDQKERVGDRQRKSVGENGKTVVEIDLPAPPAR